MSVIRVNMVSVIIPSFYKLYSSLGKLRILEFSGSAVGGKTLLPTGSYRKLEFMNCMYVKYEIYMYQNSQ